MGAEQKARELGISFPIKEKGYLNLCVRSGNMLMTSGHVSDVKGKLGAGLSVEQGYQAARECVVKVLQSVRQAHGTLDGLRVLKLLGCVNSANADDALGAEVRRRRRQHGILHVEATLA